MVGQAIELLVDMPLWLVVALSVLLVVLVGLVVLDLWRRSRANKAAKPAQANTPPKKRQEDDDPAGLGRACRQFHARLSQAFPGARARYRLPLFVAVGPSRAAITAVVRGADLGQPLGEHLSSGGLTWTAFDRAAVVEVEPGMILAGHSRADRWRAFIRLLQRFRPQRPVDGVILVLPAGELDHDDRDEARRTTAEQIRERLAELENALAMTLPVHCVVAEAETVGGFEELGRLLPTYQLERPLGFASPYSSQEVYRPALVAQAIQSLAARAQVLALEALTAEPDKVDRDALLLFPAGIERLRPGLKSFLDIVMQPGHYARLTTLRGIYLTGAVGTVRGHGVPMSAFAKGALQERIFPEYSLAEPTGRHWVGANREVRRAQAAVVGLFALTTLGLFAQDRILSNRVPQVHSLVSAVEKDYERISIARAEQGGAADLFRDQNLEFVDRLSRLDGGYLRSAFVPSSWFGQLPRNLERMQEGAYIEILFRSIGQSLRKRAEKVTATPPGAAYRDHRADVQAPYPDTSALKTALDRYARLATQVDHYRALSQGRRDAFALRQITNYLYDIQLPDGFFPDIRFDAEGTSGTVMRPFTMSRYVEQARTSFLELHRDFLIDLTLRDRVPTRLREIQGILSERSRLFASESSGLGRLRALYRELDGLRKLFESGRYAWLVAEPPLIDASYEALLTRASETRFLGPPLALRVRREALQTRREFRRELLGIQAPDFGAIVVPDERGLALSPQAERVRKRLEAFGLIAEAAGDDDFPRGRAQSGQLTRQIPLPVPSDSYIRWRVPALNAGTRLLDDISRRVAGDSESRAVDRALSDVVRAEKLDAIVTAVRQAAEEVPARRDLVDGGGSEADLRRRVASFRAARPFIDTFLRHLEDMGAFELRDGLMRLVGWEAEKILTLASQRLAADNLYGMDESAVDAWQGGRGLAGQAFDADTQGALIAYLAQQRARLRTLAKEFARPAMSFLFDHAVDYNPDQLQAFARWRLILETLQRYDNKAPGNPLQRLESYVLDRMQAVTVDDCAQASPARTVQSEGYMAQRLSVLARAAQDRCLALKGERVRQAYAALSASFNENLAGRAPFVTPSQMGTAPGAPPEALARFIDTFDRRMNEGIAEPRYWASAAKADRVRTFLERLDRAVSALRPAIQEGETGVRIGYDVTAEFRVNRAEEIGANHVLGWSLAVGDRRRSLFNAAESIAWSPGERVSVDLTWAKDAPSRPTDAADVPGLSVEGRTARIGYDGLWSLFALITRHRVASGAGADRSGGHLLRLALPVTYTGAADGEARLEGGRARMFLRLRLHADGRTVRLPEFPTRAPTPQVSNRGADSDRAG